MKKETHRRTIKPQPGTRGATRPGVIEFTQLIPENAQEMDALLESCAPDPAGNLKAIIEDCNLFASLAKRGRSGSPIAERGSPEYYAIEARRDAQLALAHMEASDAALAVRYAMRATREYWAMIFAHKWEPEVARAIAQSPPKGGRTQKPWAVELGKQLAHEFQKFPQAWDAIPQDDDDNDNRYAGYEVYRTDDCLHASSNELGNDYLPKSTFRTEYFYPARPPKK